MEFGASGFCPVCLSVNLSEIVAQKVLWSIWGSHQTLWSLPLPNVTWHSGTWPYTMTHSIDQTLHQSANLLPNWTLLPILTLLPNFWGFHRTLQRVRLANRGRLLLRTPGPVPFGTCICSNVETILSWTCYVYGLFESRTSLGTSILLCGKNYLLQSHYPNRRSPDGRWAKNEKIGTEFGRFYGRLKTFLSKKPS